MDGENVDDSFIQGSPVLRFPWNGFPPVVIAATQSAVKQHLEYEAAKTGDVPSAKRLAAELTANGIVGTIRDLIAGRPCVLVPVHALENQGYNRIPAAFAEFLSERLGLDVELEIVQANVVNHTGASGWERMSRPPLFDGPVRVGSNYFLVDDFVGQGGTLANLRGYLIHGGGTVIGATTLTGRADSATLGLQAETLRNLRGKHGEAIENWWQTIFGYRFECLTESEARYLLRVEDADTIRMRLTEAGSQEHD